MKLFTLITITALSIAANSAPNYGRETRSERNSAIVQKSEQIAETLRTYNGRFSKAQKNAIESHLDAINAIIYSGGSTNQGNKLLCVARDNDGRAPWVAAVQRDYATVNKLNAIAFQEKQECENSLKSGRYIFDSSTLLVCGSRDRDGRSPFSLFSIDTRADSATIFNKGITVSMESCQSQLRDLQETNNSIAFCTSRDNDGRAPWVLVVNYKDGTSKVRSESFSTYQDCLTVLR